MRPVNGLFAQEVEGVNPLLWELTRADNLNIFLASPTAAGLERLELPVRTIAEIRAGWTLLDGAHFVEDRPDGTRFRWCGPRALLRLDGAGPHQLCVSTVGLASGEEQTIRLVAGATVGGS